MDFILRSLERKIKVLLVQNNQAALRVYYQARYEYVLMLLLGYLWSKNFSALTIESKEHVAINILKPSIGTIVDLIRRLDIDKVFFSNKKVQKSINKYPEFRNEKLGHGYTFEDGNGLLLELMEELQNGLMESNINFFSKDLDIVQVSSVDSYRAEGIVYKANGSDYFPWSCPIEVNKFEKGSIYIYLNELGYHKISPFILIEEESEFYIFASIQEKLSGLTKYNRLIKTGHTFREVPEFANLVVEVDGIKWKSGNGTVLNNFTKNYKKYIETGVKEKIKKFLLENKSSVFATLWGHGGVGKTAAIQSACDDLANDERRKFDYIIFVSAKDRYYNYFKGAVEDIIADKVDSLEAIIMYVNEVLFSLSSSDYDEIINFEGQLLIIIDDFETFSNNEQSKILGFIRALNINYHKVIITTRAATLIMGEEIKTNELNKDETLEFLLQVIDIEVPSVNIAQLKKSLDENNSSQKVFEVTGGRPLFIFQFAMLLGQRGDLNDVLTVDIKSNSEAIRFLYDRIYDYLSPVARNIFITISLLVDANDLSNVIDKLRYLLGMEDFQDDFDSAINELIKLKIIEVIDKKFFKVYSYEILKMMNSYYQEGIGPDRVKLLSNLALVGKDKKLDNDQALLSDADSSRITGAEGEVVTKYRALINRPHTSLTVKQQAALNLGGYLFSARNNAEAALRMFSDYKHLFNTSFKFTKPYVKYLWAAEIDNSREEAISVLSTFLWKKHPASDEQNLQLMSLLATYQTILITHERESIKEEKRFDMISADSYKEKIEDQKKRFLAIAQYPGNKLVSTLNSGEIADLNPMTKTELLDALVHLVEVYIRVNRFSKAKEICYKVFDVLPQNFHSPFLRKLERINMYTQRPKQSDGELASKLRDALKNNKH